jgi:8-oxo-dGTP pyrophosphatase MutT (NUDIX family)
MAERPKADVRDVVRVVLVDRRNRVLLLRIIDAEGRLAWGLAGGGVEAGETDHETAIRELIEEFDLTAVQIGPLVSKREHVFPVGGRPTLWRERHYFASLESGRVTHEQARWWTVAELNRSRARFAPSRLRTVLALVLVEGPPQEPVDLGHV